MKTKCGRKMKVEGSLIEAWIGWKRGGEGFRAPQKMKADEGVEWKLRNDVE